MLAQNFQTPEALGITDVEFRALATVLTMLETEQITDAQFNMAAFQHECGTPSCICGWANFVSAQTAFPMLPPERQFKARPELFGRPNALINLFGAAGPRSDMWDIWRATPAQAAKALRSFLTTGWPNWPEAMRSAA